MSGGKLDFWTIGLHLSCGSNFNHCYVIGSQNYRIRWNNTK